MHFIVWEGCANYGMLSGVPFKFLKITITPQILCLKLNFFDQHYNLVSHDVQPLEEVDIDGVSFYLQSVIFHSGDRKAGHYWAIVRHIAFGENSWWLYDDSIRRRVNGPSWKASAMQVQRTYMLLYSRTMHSPSTSIASESATANVSDATSSHSGFEFDIFTQLLDNHCSDNTEGASNLTSAQLDANVDAAANADSSESSEADDELSAKSKL